MTPNLYTGYFHTGTRPGIPVGAPRPGVSGYILEKDEGDGRVVTGRHFSKTTGGIELNAVIQGLECAIQNHAEVRVLSTTILMAKAIRFVLPKERRPDFMQNSLFRLDPVAERQFHFSEFDTRVADEGQLERLADVVREMRVLFTRMNQSDSAIRNHEIQREAKIQNIVFMREIGWPHKFKSS